MDKTTVFWYFEWVLLAGHVILGILKIVLV